jgi:hypothetical protein
MWARLQVNSPSRGIGGGPNQSLQTDRGPLCFSETFGSAKAAAAELHRSPEKTMTREEVEIEADEIMRGQSLPEHARPSFVAFLEHSNGLPIDQICPYCRGAIWVEDHGRAWTVRCPCGRCTNSFRGL